MSSTTKTVETTTAAVTVVQSEVKVNGKVYAAILEFEAAKAEIKVQEAKKEAAEEIIWAALAGADKGIFKGIVVVKTQDGTSTSANFKLMREGYPEAAAACINSKPYKFLKGLV